MVVARTRTALAAVVTLRLGVVSASAQTIEQNRKMCGDDSAAPAVAIRACTTLIESGVVLAFHCAVTLPNRKHASQARPPDRKVNLSYSAR